MSSTHARLRTLLAVATLCGGTFSAHAADVALARLDCGSEPQPVSVAAFSDTYAYPDLKVALIYSCYLIRHGDRYLLWDTGMAMDGTPHAPRTSLLDQLARLNLRAESVQYVGISHYHYDHTGQLAAFPKATLLIGQGVTAEPVVESGFTAVELGQVVLSGQDLWRRKIQRASQGGRRRRTSTG